MVDLDSVKIYEGRPDVDRIIKEVISLWKDIVLMSS